MATDSSFILSHRSVIAVGGVERRAFLQGLISNDMDVVSKEQAIYAALLTPQGKFLHDLFIIHGGEEFLIDCETVRADDLLKRLAAYKLRAKVTFRDLRSECDVWAFGGQRLEAGGQIVFTDPRLPELGMRAIAEKGSLEGLKPLASDLYDKHRLALGVPDGSRDMIVEKSVLTDGNFDLLNGISFTKGCYVGQEITARMHYRALVKKRMFPVKIEGPAPIFGTAIQLDGAEIGEMRSTAGDVGLALLNLDKAEAAIKDNVPLICGESQLKPFKPGWMKL
jgi:tRNA-modifying protein YgfZ